MKAKEIADRIGAILGHVAEIAAQHPELVSAIGQIIVTAAKAESP